VGCLGSIALFVVCAIWQILDGPIYWILVVFVTVTSGAELVHFVANIFATRERERASRQEPDSPPSIEPRW
jgi:hypothetical protein